MEQEIFTLIGEGKWLPLAALLLGFVVRLLKSDTKIPINVAPEHRTVLAIALGAVVGVIEGLAGGTPVGIIVYGLGAPTIAIVGHLVGIEKLRKGREIPVPGLMRKPPDDRDRIAFPPGPVAIVVILLTFGCSGTFDDRKALGAHDRKLGAPQGSPERCSDLSDAQDNWTLVGKVGAGVGVSGALAPVHEAVRDDPTGRWVSLGVASGGALLAGVGVHMADVKGGRYVQEGCGR